MTGRAMCVFKIGGSLGRDGALTGVCRTLGDLARAARDQLAGACVSG